MFITSLDKWSATFVSPPLFPTSAKQFSLSRANFSLPCNITAAALHMSGIGYSIASINGHRVGDHELSPTWTRYDRMVFYVTHDITHLLRANSRLRGGPLKQDAVCDHVIDVMLGSGHFSSDWYGGPLAAMLLAQINAVPPPSLHPQPSPPPSLVVAATGAASWAFTSDAPLMSSSVYGGEMHNATAAHHEGSWTWLPAACSPPLPQHPSEPQQLKLSPQPRQHAQPSPVTSLYANQPLSASIHTSSSTSQGPALNVTCSLALQLNGSMLLPERQVSNLHVKMLQKYTR